MTGFKRKFNWRSFISLYMTFSGIIIAVSGAILYIGPPGRIANWSRIPILGLEKSQWQALHTIFTFLLLIAMLFHIYFNWKPLMAYLKTRRNQKIKIRSELWISVLVTVVLFGLILTEIPPFTTVLDFGESIKDSWATQQNEPPVPHAEDLTLKELAQTIDKDVVILLSNLSAHGVDAHQDQVVKDLAVQYGTTPSTLLEQMKLQKKKSETASMQGRGYGRMTVAEMCSQLEVDPEQALHRLQEAGIRASRDESIKNLATDNNMRPSDLVDIISGIQRDHFY
ncbi:MAG: DUF4405 domain-containing protein [Candidatus Marinimicrobia bacterium]|nr:DUF4405 domain-containing protein [Candidatus Neomarinimicrobiota bacterium]